MNNEELMVYHQNRLKETLMLMDACNQAAVMVRAKAKTTSDSLMIAAEEFRRESEDIKYYIEEIKISLGKNDAIPDYRTQVELHNESGTEEL